MSRENVSARFRVRLVCTLLLAFLPACQETAEKPKRADDAAAHSARYHPDVVRRPPTASRPSQTLATQPVDWERLGPGPIGSPVVFVNGQTLTIGDVLEPLVDEFARQAKALSERDYRESVIRLVRNAMDYQISLLLVGEEARKQYSDKKVQEAFDKRVDELIAEMITVRFGGVKARYETHLRTLDITAADMRERIKREAMVKEFLREKFRPMLKEPPRRELMAYYQAHLADFTSLEKAELFMIEVPVSAELEVPAGQASEAELASARKRARARIERAREELESGVDFGSVARAYSRGAMAQQGGSWGEISPGALTKHWARAAETLFTLKPGQLSGIIETDEAFFIVKCGRRTPAERLSFEQAQRKITERLLEEQFVRLRNEYIQQLLDRATIEKRPEFFQALLAAVPRHSRPEPPENATGSTETIERWR